MHENFIHERYDISRDYVYMFSQVNYISTFEISCFCEWNKLAGELWHDSYTNQNISIYKIKRYNDRRNIIKKDGCDIFSLEVFDNNENLIIKYIYVHDNIIDATVTHFLYKCPDENKLKDFLFYYKLLGDTNA
jgi:hypothetical protein